MARFEVTHVDSRITNMPLQSQEGGEAQNEVEEGNDKDNDGNLKTESELCMQ